MVIYIYSLITTAQLHAPLIFPIFFLYIKNFSFSLFTKATLFGTINVGLYEPRARALGDSVGELCAQAIAHH